MLTISIYSLDVWTVNLNEATSNATYYLGHEIIKFLFANGVALSFIWLKDYCVN